MSYPMQQSRSIDNLIKVNMGPGADGQPRILVVAQAGHEGAKTARTEPGMPAATAGSHEGSAAAGHESSAYEMPEELPNVATWIESVTHHKAAAGAHEGKEAPSGVFHIGKVPIPIDPLFSIFYAILIVWVIRKAMRRASVERPGKLQNLIEAVMGGLRNFFVSIMGPVGEKYVPYVGSLWLFIWVNNMAGLIPGMKAPTSSFKVTFALGLCTFCYVQYNAIKEGGIKGWLYHLMGSPTDAVTWALAPLFLVLEVIGELVKPVSLSLRLFGNIFGEDKLLASFLGMGMLIMASIMGTAHPIVGIPLHVIFYPLVVLTSTIQATVFALLASIYIVLLLPHEHAHEEHGAEGHDEHAEPAADKPHDSVAAAGQV
jgi:F-type H+-transporting ATPase subunit a